MDEITLLDKDGNPRYVVADRDYVLIDGNKVPVEELSDEDREKYGIPKRD